MLNHLRVEDPGRIKGNVVFTNLDAIDEDPYGLSEIKAHYQRSGLGNGKIKACVEEISQMLIAPIRESRSLLSEDQS